MFRTHNKRGLERFIKVRGLEKFGNGTLPLNKEHILLIEDSAFLSTGEKIELLLLSLGQHLTGEIFQKIRYTKNEEKRSINPYKQDIENIESLLRELPFGFYRDKRSKRNKEGYKDNFTWFQIFLNPKVEFFMKNYRDDMTEFEEGILYGFPISAIRAFSGLIDQKVDNLHSVEMYYLAGVCSSDFFEEELRYYQQLWQKIRKISPKIIRQAETEFNKKVKKK